MDTDNVMKDMEDNVRMMATILMRLCIAMFFEENCHSVWGWYMISFMMMMTI